jgi:hypothetical protein
MSTLESRLAAIERQLRFHRLVNAGLLVALVALVGYGATKGVPDVIRAKSFAVVDAAGKVRIKLAVTDHKVLDKSFPEPALEVLGGNGEPLVTFGENLFDEGYLSIMSSEFHKKSNGSGIIWLGIDGEHNPSIEMRPDQWNGIADKVRIDTAPSKPSIAINAPLATDAKSYELNQSVFQVWGADSPGILISNKRGKVIISEGTTNDGDGILTVHDKEGKDRVKLLGGMTGGGGITIWNKTDEQVVQALADEYGMGFVGAFDRQGKGHVLQPR